MNLSDATCPNRSGIIALFEYPNLQESRIANGVVLSPNMTLAEVLREDEMEKQKGLPPRFDLKGIN